MPKGSRELTAQRKEEIIQACKKLYRTISFKDITLKQIADATSFTRTSIYNYFETKEEIFLAILQKEYESWINDLNLLKENKKMSKKKLAQEIARSIDNHHMMLKILSMNHFDLEENSRLENLSEFKVVYGKTLKTIEELLKQFCPDIDTESFIYSFFPFLYGIYPYTYVSDKQKKAMSKAKVDFKYHTVYDLSYTFILRLLEAK